MTAEQNTKRAACAIRMFGDVPLQKLTPMRIEQDLGELLARGGKRTEERPNGSRLSPKTVREIAALVSQALDKAVRYKKLERNPMEDVERPAAHRKEVEIIEPDEYENFLNRVQGTRYYALSVLAAASGCRRGELLALRWPDINPKSGVVTVANAHAMKNDEATAAKLWDEATEDIIARTRKSPGKADVIVRDPKRNRAILND